MNFDQIERMGLAESRLSGYRTRRPKRRPKKTKGHGAVKIIIGGWRDRLKAKRPPEHVTRIAVPSVPMPGFLSKLLALRPEAKRLMTAEQYAALKEKNGK